MTIHPTVVIGAGVAGLRCASRLVEAGEPVRVLEARPRIGGRLDTFDVLGVRFDVGATWYWSNEPRVAELIEIAGLEVFAQHLDGDALLHTVDGVQRADGNPIDVPSGRFVGGARAVTEALAAKLPTDSIELGAAVNAVRRSAGHIVVETERGDAIDAGSVVIAVPPALAMHLIEFTPALPERVGALAAHTPVWMGGTTKVVAVYERPFWREDGLAGSAMSYVGPLREVHDMSAPPGGPGAIFGFAPSPGPGASISPESVVEQLVELFGSEAASPVDLRIVDWSAEQYTSPPGASSMQAYQTYGHPIFAEPLFDGAVTWASTETSAVNPGHIEGALFAGERAAELTLQRRQHTRLMEAGDSHQ